MIENSLFCLMKSSPKIGKEGLTAGKLPPIKECTPLSILKNVQWGISSCFSIKPIRPPLLYSITVPKMYWFHLTKNAFGTLRNQLNNISFFAVHEWHFQKLEVFKIVHDPLSPCHRNPRNEWCWISVPSPSYNVYEWTQKREFR
jgi:hypothetical protein